MAKEILVRCRFSDSGRGYGFAEVLDGSREDLFIAPDETAGAMTGDTVLVHVYRPGEAGYNRGNEGRVTKIAERGNPEIIGTFHMRGAYGIVTPDERKLYAEVTVSGRDIGAARDGDKVSVRITEFPPRRRGDALFRPEGYVTAVFGRAESSEANYAAVLHRNGIPTEFSDDVIWEAEDAAARAIVPDGRLDLRTAPTLTIDGADAKDLDDAISLSRTESGWTLGVHIADVSHYVPENSAVDREAYARGTSVYFVDQVVPMLPTALSNGACSLNGGEDRYALSALIELDENGTMRGCDFRKSIIRSDVRGVYSEVNDLFENGRASAFAHKYAAVADMLADMHALYKILRRAADERGQFSMESAEAQFVLDEHGVPTDILPRERGEAEMMIEQFMLAANVAAASWLTSRGLPCLYRVHEDPQPEKMRALAVFAHNMDLDASGIGPDTSSARLSRLLAEAEARGIGDVVSGVILRSLAKAKYSERPAAHFGLAAELYCHFTSPIRRYPDLFVHRAISSVLTGSRLPAHAAESARVSTDAEIRAATAEREIEALYMARYADLHAGEECDAIISSVCSFGIFARTDKLIEGLIPTELLFGRGAKPDYDEERMTLRLGERTFRLGEKIRIRIEHGDITTGRIDFAPVNIEIPRPPRRGDARPRKDDRSRRDKPTRQKFASRKSRGSRRK